MKGCRTSILNSGAFACATDEVSNTLPTPWSDHSAGINFLSKSKLNTFSQAEHDSVVTAAGRICLNSYKTMIKLSGQLEATEWVLRPNPNGFPKRPGLSDFLLDVLLALVFSLFSHCVVATLSC